MAETNVTVKSRSYFRGEPTEGKDGMVSPGDELRVSRSRAADLKVNGLVDTISDAAPDAPLAAQVTAAEGDAIDAPPADGILQDSTPTKTSKK